MYVIDVNKFSRVLYPKLKKMNVDLVFVFRNATTIIPGAFAVLYL
jgi:hypothetical protein